MYNVLRYIHDNIKERLNVYEVASKFGYSRFHFCKKFHEYTDTTFVDYVRRYRVQLAAIEILQDKKVTDVAMDYGYDTVVGFNKAFLKFYGCLPREYKKRAKESQLYYERRRQNMYKLSDRCSVLREDAVNQKNHMKKYALQRDVYFLLGGEKAKEEGMHKEEIFASAVANVLDKFKPFIAPGELVCGFNYGDGKYHDTYNPGEDEDAVNVMSECGISEEDIERFCKLDKNAKFKLFGVLDYNNPTITEKERQANDEWAAVGRCIDSNHSVLGYEKVLKLGFEGVLEEIEKAEKKNGDSPFYRGTKRVCRAALTIGEKYAEEAKSLLDSDAAIYNKEDLEKIVDVCNRVPRYPATTFLEAVQSLWFAHIINTWEDWVNANSLGRLDQILYPYYKNDIEKGLITKDEAFEIVCCLWIKLYRDYDVQQSCVGGTSPGGKSDVNDLSYMMLDATEALDFVRCLSVRYSKNTEKDFLKRALEVVGHVQKGVPFFFNDDVMIPALMDKGIEEKDAHDYTQIGCVETVIPGKSNPHAVTGEINCLKAIEYVLNDGSSMMHPEYDVGVKTGALTCFNTYEKFYDAILKQIENILDITCSNVEKQCDWCVAPKPYKSMLTEGCIASGKGFNDRGAKYDYYQIMLGGVPNLADSLAVIKKFVYQDKKYTLKELKEILESDFADESIRLEFVNKAPKFGNDIDEVDDIAIDIINYSCDVLEKLSEKYNRPFHAQPFTYLWMIDHGLHCVASPDGRRKGEPIAYSVSPQQGRDFNGLTAVLNSISKLPAKRTPGTTSAIIEIDPKLFTDRNIDLLTEVLIGAGKRGLSNVQFNTVDADTLIDAQKNPEKYRNLAVRVSGFSQKFNLISPELQNHIIERTKHACL